MKSVILVYSGFYQTEKKIMKHSMCWNFTNPKTYNIHPALFTLPSLPFATPCPKKTSQHRRPSTTTSSLRKQKNKFRGHGRSCSRHPPQRRPPAAAGRRCRGRFPLQGAATWRLGAPAEVQRWKVQRCMVRCFAHPNDAKKPSWVWQVSARLGNLLYITFISAMGYHSQVHPCTGPVFGSKVGTNISRMMVNGFEFTYGKRNAECSQEKPTSGKTEKRKLGRRKGPKKASDPNQIRL